MITKLISSQTVIAKVIADLNLTEESIRISDMLEWIGEAVNKIGGVSKMNPKEEIIPLCNHQAKLPCDLNKVSQVAYSNNHESGWLVTRYNTGSFMIKNNTSCNEQLVPDDELVKVYRVMYKKDNISYNDALDALNSNSELKSVLRTLINKKNLGGNNVHSTNLSMDIQYYIKPGYIVCTEKEGYLKIAYNSIPRDEFGYTLIPDDESYIEAIYWYVVMKLHYPLYVMGKIRQDVYYHSQRSWNYHSKQAYGNIQMPNLDELESIKNSWLRLYPEINEHSSFYSTLGQQQIIHNRNLL